MAVSSTRVQPYTIVVNKTQDPIRSDPTQYISRKKLLGLYSVRSLMIAPPTLWLAGQSSLSCPG